MAAVVSKKKDKKVVKIDNTKETVSLKGLSSAVSSSQGSAGKSQSVDLKEQKNSGGNDGGERASRGSSSASDLKSKRNNAWIFAVLGVFLIAIIIFAVFFLVSGYKYSFNINGVDFVSNDYTPSGFFPEFKDHNSFVVVVDLMENEGNAWVVNSMNLWIVALNADHKKVQSLVRLTDSFGALKSCKTNDGNIFVSRDVPLEECNSLISNDSNPRIFIKLSKDNRAVLSKNSIVIYASDSSTISQVNYFVIKQMYANFDDVLAVVNERINAIN